MSLAGRPPFATDEPDSFYESPPNPQPRVRQQPPADPNKRTSAYDMYNNYLGDDKSANRQSGANALGMGLMNGSLDDDDSDDDDSYHRKPQAAPGTPSSKHAALAAATGVNAHRNNTPTPPPQYNAAPIAAPRPGYAAPIAALNLARPEPTAVPQGRQLQPPQGQSQLRVDSAMPNPFETPALSPNRNPFNPPPSPISSTPHPLQPPITPITPVFARPRPPKSGVNIKFSDDPKPIMRGNSEDALIPKRGEKGDDFWRRFSIVAKEENKKPATQKQSAWLRKTQSGSTRLSRWVWVIGLALLICVGAAIGLGLYFSRNNPGHQQPTVFGGSASELAVPDQTAKAAGTGTSKSVLHVSPTHTVARRLTEPQITSIPLGHQHKRRRASKL